MIIIIIIISTAMTAMVERTDEGVNSCFGEATVSRLMSSYGQNSK